MRILIFYFSELGSLGGVEMTVLRLARAFRERGSPTGFVEIARSWKPKRLLGDGTPIWGVTAPSYPRFHRPRSWASFCRSTFQFMWAVREFRPDIIHVHYPLIQALPLLGARAFPHHWRLVGTLHGSDIRVGPSGDPDVKLWQERLFARADAVTAVSQSLLADAVRLYPCLSAKSSVIPNGVGRDWIDVPASSDQAAERYVLYVGRLHFVKGVDLLIRAWRSVADEFQGTRLWIVGEGPDLEKLQSLTKDLGLSQAVRFIPRQDQQELILLYSQAAAVVLPSRMEGLPLTLLEAGACGAICVGTGVGGIPEVIQDGVSGFLVSPDSPEALAAGIARTLRLAPEARARVRQSARETIRERFLDERVVSDYLHLFESLRSAAMGQLSPRKT